MPHFVIEDIKALSVILKRNTPYSYLTNYIRVRLLMPLTGNPPWATIWTTDLQQFSL